MGDSEYFADNRQKNNTLIKEISYDCERNKHQWSNWFSVPAGLAKECRNCHKVRIMESKEMEEAFS